MSILALHQSEQVRKDESFLLKERQEGGIRHEAYI